METHEATLLHIFLLNHSVFCLRTSLSPSFLSQSTIHKQRAAHLVDDGQIPGVGEEPRHAGHA